MTFHSACALVLRFFSDDYAKAYAKAGMKLDADDADAHEVTALYILSNISHWRGDMARDVRNALKHIADIK